MAFTSGELIKIEPILSDNNELNMHDKYILSVRVLKGEVHKYTLYIGNYDEYVLLYAMLNKEISFNFELDYINNEITSLYGNY
ncbi:hypothetical protein ACIPSR_00015 [Pectobacterium sp. CHL-2024]|uniref:hypothetical protein n=1 Tax=Pectobacterium sp. CHL-2024 TaxID=3377079 RepID=UPI00382443ED